MKSLSKRTSVILKLVLLFNLLSGVVFAETIINTDRFLLKIVDRTISVHDISFQIRNLRGLKCVYSDALVLQYFSKDLISKLDRFVKDLPDDDVGSKSYLYQHEDELKSIRYIFKMLRYTEDQKHKVSPQLTQLIRESTKENGCEAAILYKDTLKTNFRNLLELELYFRSRYGAQMKSNNNRFDSIRSSIDLFVDSLDKQFTHEYYR